MKTYIKFLTSIFLKSFLNVLIIIFSLVVLINLLTEIEFFSDLDVNIFFPLHLSLLNSPSMIFEIFPFIFLISTQLFFIKLFNNNEITIFKYSGLKNSKILFIISILTLCLSILIVTVFYNISSNLKNFYLELKTGYTKDNKYLAVVNKNGLWIRDKIDNTILIVNSSKIDENFLIDNFITEFDENYNVKRNIISKKINIKTNNWVIFEPKIINKNIIQDLDSITTYSNFNYKLINSLFSNLSSLSIFELIELKKNYEQLNYSTIDIDIQIQKIITYPIYLILMTILSGLIMFNSRKYKSNTLKISIGLFLCVLIYYLNNLFNVMGATEKINHIISIWIPMLILSSLILLSSSKINEK